MRNNRNLKGILKNSIFKKNRIEFDEIAETILRSTPKKNRRFVEKKLELLEDNWMDYLFYWNEKFYMCGFVYGTQMII